MPYITLSGIGAGVARLFWEQEAVSSNPTSPTIVDLNQVGRRADFLFSISQIISYNKVVKNDGTIGAGGRFAKFLCGCL